MCRCTMYNCTSVCLAVCRCLSVHVFMHVCRLCMHVRTYVCMYDVCMYVCMYVVGWSEIGSKNFFLQFQLARYVKKCQFISRTLCKNFKIFEKCFDLPFQLFILQYYMYAVLKVTGSLAFS